MNIDTKKNQLIYNSKNLALLAVMLVASLLISLSSLVASPKVGAREDVVDSGAAVTTDCSTTTGLFNGMQCAKSDSMKAEINSDVISTITNTILFIVGAVAVIMLIYGGFQYVTSGGDSGKVTNAKNTIMYAVIGIIVALLSYAILKFVTGMIGGNATV